MIEFAYVGELYFFVNGSALFDCGNGIFYNSKNETASRLSLEGLKQCRVLYWEYCAFLVSNWLVWVRVRQEPSEQREFSAFFVSNWLVWAGVCMYVEAKV